MKNPFLKITSTTVVFGIFCFGLFLSNPQGVEASLNELDKQLIFEQKIEQIEDLLGTVISLQRDLEARKINGLDYINSNSLVKTKGEIQVMESPGSNAKVLGLQNANVEGLVSNDLRYRNGKIWWLINFELGVDGWVPEASLTRIPSVILNIDTNSDGNPDSKIRLVGEYELDKFIIENKGDGSQIKYIGKDLNKRLSLGTYRGYLNISLYL